MTPDRSDIIRGTDGEIEQWLDTTGAPHPSPVDVSRIGPECEKLLLPTDTLVNQPTVRIASDIPDIDVRFLTTVCICMVGIIVCIVVIGGMWRDSQAKRRPAPEQIQDIDMPAHEPWSEFDLSKQPKE